MMDFNKVRMTEMEQEQNAERNGVGMNQMMKVFESQQFGKVRVVMQEGEPWFVAVDVCNALEIINSRDAVARLDEDEKNTVVLTDGIRGNPNKVVVNEAGLYTLILGSRKPEAKQFKRWITHEVIPSIRKYGAYVTTPMLERFMEQPELILVMAQQMLTERAGREEAEVKLKTAQPKADYFDQFVNADDTTNIRNTGKELGIPQNRLITFLLAHHYLYREKRLDGKLMPIAQMNRGYFIVKDVYTPARKLTQQTFMTCKGKEHFRKKIEQILEETA